MRYIIIETKTMQRVSAYRFMTQQDALEAIRIWRNYSNPLWTPTLGVLMEGSGSEREVNGL